MQDCLRILVPVGAPLIVAWLTYWNYLKQREHELVRRRYLDDGMDLFIANLEQSLSVFRHNWSLALFLLKQYRDVEKGFDEKTLSGFLPVNQTGMNITASHRLRLLINDDIGWIELQKTFAFVTAANAFFQHDLALACRTLSTGELQLAVPKQVAVDQYTRILTGLNQESTGHYAFLSELLMLSTIIEREKFTFKTISQFHLRDDVRAIIKAMKSRLAERETNEQSAEKTPA